MLKINIRNHSLTLLFNFGKKPKILPMHSRNPLRYSGSEQSEILKKTGLFL